VSVAAQILKCLLGVGKRTLCIGNPYFFNTVNQLLEVWLRLKGRCPFCKDHTGPGRDLKLGIIPFTNMPVKAENAG